ncbi:hypothetical protein ABFS83_04G224600 [Erythranthe nasuta]
MPYSSPSTSPSPPPPPPPPQQQQQHPPSRSHSSSPSLSPKHGPPRQPATESKKSPPVPWSDEETLAIIKAYQEKWYSLKKGQLKAFQWEEVSVTIAARCGLDEPSKTATQCRHKIEKLRKRYRSELQKPYSYSWQYFDLMDQMERGPIPVNARPISAGKSFHGNGNSNTSNYGTAALGYDSLYSNSADYYNGGESGNESEGKWNMGYYNNNNNNSVELATRNKSKSINNIVRGEVKSWARTAKRMSIERGFSRSSNRITKVSRNPVNGKRKQRCYDGDDDVEEEEHVLVEDEREESGRGRGGGGGAMELAAEIRCFTEKFVGMENKKIEMMSETQRYRAEIEKKRKEMILDAERKIIDTIDRVFRAS